MPEQFDVITRTLPHFDSLLTDNQKKILGKSEEKLHISIDDDLSKIQLSLNGTISISPELARRYASILNALANSIENPLH